MISKRLSKTAGAVSAAALIASMGFAPLAFGQSTQNYNNVNGIEIGNDTQPTLTLTKEIYAASTIATSGDQYQVYFSKTKDGDFDNTDDAGSYIDGPALGPVTLTAIAMDGTADGTHTLAADKQTITGTLTIPALGSGGFEHAGLYEYIVYEGVATHGTGGTATGRTGGALDSTTGAYAASISDTNDNWTDSVARYVLRIYIANVGGQLQYDGITLEEVNSDDATTETIPTAPMATTAKISPNPSGTAGSTTGGIRFVNRSSATTDLKIHNLNSGSFARQDQAFTFNYRISLTLPAGAATPTATYLVTDTGGTTAQSGTAITWNNGTATIETALGHDDYVTISGLPVGTTYEVKEWSTKASDATDETELKEGINNYKGKANYKNSSSDGVDQAEGTAGQSYTVGAPSVYAALSVTSGQNVMTITNTLDSPPSPTEFALNYAPYVIVGIIAAGGIIALAVSSKKRRDKKNEIMSKKED